MKYLSYLFVLTALLWSNKSIAYDIEVDGFYYNVLSATTLEVTYGDKKYSGDVSIPATVTYNGKTYNVVSVGTKAFAECEDLLSIYMGKNISSIGGYAFYKCSSLKSYKFFTTNIGDYAFAYCKSITSFKSSNMEDIPNGMFEGCTSLSSISFKALYIGANAFNGCTSLKGEFNCLGHIGAYAFKGCTGITSVTINTTQKTLGGTVIYKNAFSGCTSLTKITLKNSLNDDIVNISGVGEGFGECPNLEEIVVEQLYEELNYETEDNGLYRSKKKLLSFLAPKRKTSVYVTPNGLGRILGYSLSTKGNLRRLVLGGTNLEILENAFYNCAELEEIFIYNKKPNEIRINDYFDPNKFSRLKIYVPTGCKSLYEQVSPWKNFTIEEFDVINFDPYEISEEVDGIKYKITSDTEVEVAHKDDYSGDIVIPETVSINDKEYKVTSIGKDAFRLSPVNTISIPNSVTSIGEGAFFGSKITSIEIPNSITTIEKSTFNSCYSLKSIIIPNNVERIEELAFYGCFSLESVVLPQNLKVLGAAAFCDCSCLKEIVVPEKMERIAAWTFRNCSKLEAIVIPNKITSIGDAAFASCHNIKTIVMGKNIKSIGQAAFSGCTLKDIYTLNDYPPTLNVSDNDSPVGISPADITVTFEYRNNNGSTYKTATLWVPESSLDEYKNHIDWGQFVNIQAFDPNTFNPSTLGIKTITNYEEEMNRYSIDGRKLSMPTKGVNIIRMKNGTVKKVLMK